MKKSTLFAHIGRPKVGAETSVNHPITRASTLLFKKADDLYNGKHRIYGTHGSPVHDALEEAFCALEDGAGCTLTSSGLAANTLSILANVKSGDHILVSDSSYGPIRAFLRYAFEKNGRGNTILPAPYWQRYRAVNKRKHKLYFNRKPRIP